MGEPVALVPLGVLFGLLFGSFLNVCIFRIPRDLSVVLPRSFCPRCDAPIAWYDNIPVASYLLLRGRCRHCSQPIGWRYLAVELATPTIFGLVLARYGSSLLSLKWLLFESLLIVLFATDVEERILPDELTIGGTLIGLLLAFFIPVQAALLTVFLPLPETAPLRSALLALLSAAILAFPFWAITKLYERFRTPDAMGLGDIKLLGLLGAFLGLDGGVTAAMIGTVAGAIFGILYAGFTRQSLRTAALPFGAFLCAGGALVPFLPMSSPAWARVIP